jgi:hypothetical protein
MDLQEKIELFPASFRPKRGTTAGEKQSPQRHESKRKRSRVPLSLLLHQKIMLGSIFEAKRGRFSRIF